MSSRPRWWVVTFVLMLLASSAAAPVRAAETYVLRPVARTGEPAPGGGVFDRFSQEALPILAPVNTRGDVAFFATLTRGGVDEGIFLRRGDRVLAVARKGDRVADLGRISGFGKHPTPALNDAGTVAFAAAVAGGRAVEGIFAWSGGRLRVIAATARAAPGVPSGVLAALDAPNINLGGEVVFLATVRRGRESIDAIFAGTGGALRKIVAQGDLAPAGGTFVAFGPPVINASGAVAFAAVVEGKSVPGGIFVASRDRIQMAVGAGQQTPLGGIFARFSERLGFNDSSVLAFHGMLKFAPVESAIFAVDGSRVRAVAQLGDAAPGGGTISHFGLWPAVSTGGAIAFAASIDGGPSPMAILLADQTRVARVVAVGDSLPGPERIASLTLFPVVSLGSRGQVTFAVAPSATGEGPEGLFTAEPVGAR